MSKKSPQRTSESSALFGFGKRVPKANGRVRIKIRWGRVGAALACMAVLAWIAFSGFVYYVFKERRGYEAMTVADAVAFPFSRAEFQAEFGDWQVERGLEAMQSGDIRAAMLYLRTGLARSPTNKEARLVLAEFDRFNGRPDLALGLIRDGLQHHGDDMEYLKLYLRILLNEREDNELQEFARTQLKNDQQTDRNKAIAFAAVQSHMLQGEFATAEDYLNRFNLQDTPPGVATLAQMEWSRGLHSQAIERLQEFAFQHPGWRLDIIYSPLIRFLRQEGRYNEAIRYGLMHANGEEVTFAPVVELIHSYHQAGQTEKVKEEVEAYFRTYSKDEAAMRNLGNFATETGDIKLSRRVYEQALMEGFELGSFGLLYIESHLVAKRYDEALKLCQEIEVESPAWLARLAAQFHALRAASAFGAGRIEQGQVALAQFLQMPRIRADELIAIASRFSSVGLYSQARQVLERAHATEPDNQIALSQIIQLELDTYPSDAFPEHVEKLLQLRRPSREVLLRAQKELVRDRYIFYPNRPQIIETLRQATSI